MPSSVSWSGGATGFWDVAGNWSNGVVPTSSDDVSISAATVTIRASDVEAVKSLTSSSNGTLSITGGALTVSANSTNGGVLNLSGGALTFNAGLSNSGTVTVGPACVMSVGGTFSQTTSGVLSLPGAGLPLDPVSNLLVNPDFESPVVSGPATTGWSTWGTSSRSSQFAFNGSQSFQASGASSGAVQEFPVTPGASYTLSVDAMFTSADPLTRSEGGYLQLLFFDSGESQISNYNPPNAVTILTRASAAGGPLAGSVGGQGWNHFNTTAVAPANAATARAVLITGSFDGTGAGGGTVYWDHAQFGPSVPIFSQFNAGGISNNGSITVGPTNSINVTGAFAQSATGSLDLQIGGAPTTGYYGTFNAGSASLGGTFKSDILYGYAPSTTDAFVPMTFATEAGDFATYQLPGGAGYQFKGAASFTNVALSAVPTAPVTATVDASTVLHAASTGLIGVNLNWWDSSVTSAQTRATLQAAGMTSYRFPGGSSADANHFNSASNNFSATAITLPQFAQVIEAAGGTGTVTIDYGSGSPQEAAAELAYLQGSPTDATVIGTGLQWNEFANLWQSVDWKTVGYWASLRGASPLATDDGLNFMRISHPAPFSNIHYWEVGNEQYGFWEEDHHGTPGPGGVSTGTAHDPTTYMAFTKQFANFAAGILAAAGGSPISIGIDSDDPTGVLDNNWTKNTLTAGLAIGFVPNFLSDHSYMEVPNYENDSFLLDGAATQTVTNLNWTIRYNQYQSVMQSVLGAQAANIQLLATEFNSVYANPGKQSTSLVNGLAFAESLGGMLDSGYTVAHAWDLRNDWNTTGNNSPSLYGWRIGGDDGLIGASGTAPASGPFVPYPTYFAEQLASKLIQTGGQVISVATNYQELNVYGVLQPNGHLALLVINTNAAASLTAQFNLTGFQPNGQATFWQYGKAQDTAQSQTADGAASLANFNAALSLSGSGFSCAFPSYSMTVIDMAPGAGPLVTGVSPPGGPMAGGATATITGFGLANATAVKFGGVSASIISNSATQITVTVPAGLGIVDVTVTTAGGTSTVNAADKFTYGTTLNSTHGGPAATVSLAALDPNPIGSVTYSASLTDPLFALETTYGFTLQDGNFNYRGQNEKYLLSSKPGLGWYILMPDGNIYSYVADSNDDLVSTLKGTSIATVAPSVYYNPSLLTASTGVPMATSGTNPLYDLKIKYGLVQAASLFNDQGAGEYSLQSTNRSNYAHGGRYLLLPNNTLVAWNGVSAASSPLVADLSPYGNVYADPTLLTNAKLPTAVGVTAVVTQSGGGSVTLTPAAGFDRSVQVTVKAVDSSATKTQTFTYAVSDSAPTIPTITDKTVAHNSGPVSFALGATDSGDPSALTYTLNVSNPLYDIQTQFGITKAASNYNYRGLNEWYFLSTNGSNPAGLGYYVLQQATGNLYAFDIRDLNNHNLAFTFSATPVAFMGAAVSANPALLPSAAPASTVLVNRGPLFDIQAQLGLTFPAGAFNFRGANEWYLQSSNGSNPDGVGYYVLFPDGSLKPFDIADLNRTTLTATSADPALLMLASYGVYANPALLTAAQPAFVGDPLYAIKYQFGLNKAAGSLGYRGQSEWYFQSDNGSNPNGMGYYVLRSNGSLYAFDIRDLNATNNLNFTFASTPVANPGLSVYGNPSLLSASTGRVAAVTATVDGTGQVTITPNPGFAGTAKITATVSDGAEKSSTSFLFTVTDNAPTLNPPGGTLITTPRSSGTITIANLGASDTNPGDATLSFAASATTLFDLRAQFGLTTADSNLNYRGKGEKYFLSSNGSNPAGLNYYVLMPNNLLYAFNKTDLNNHNLNATLAQAPVVDLSPYGDIFNNTSLLFSATTAPAIKTDFSNQSTGGKLQINWSPSFSGKFLLKVFVSDGALETQQTFVITLT